MHFNASLLLGSASGTSFECLCLVLTMPTMGVCFGLPAVGNSQGKGFLAATPTGKDYFPTAAYILLDQWTNATELTHHCVQRHCALSTPLKASVPTLSPEPVALIAGSLIVEPYIKVDHL